MALELDTIFQGTGTLYAVARSGALVWNGTAFVAWVDADIANYDIPLTSQGGDLYAANFPATVPPGSNYRVIYYQQAGATPVTADLLLTTEVLDWNGVTASAPATIKLDIVFQGTGTLYAVIRSGTLVWNGTAFVAFVDADIANYDIALASQGGDLYAASFPAAVPTGRGYRVLYYEQVGVAPAITDLLLTTAALDWNGATATPPVAGYLGAYTTESQIVQFLGQFGIDVYADVNGDGTADAGAVSQAIVTAEGTVNFRAGGPFTVTPGTVGAAMLEKWTRYLASVEIAQKRLGVDATAVASLRTLREEAYAEMEMYADGRRNLPGAVPPIEAVDATPPAGTFQFMTIDRGIRCRGDEYSSAN